MFSEPAFSDQNASPVTDRRVKYIAKRAAKNISSELNQMIVPTLVRFGRLTVGCACPVSTVVAVATTDIMSVAYPALTPGGALRSVSGSGREPGRDRTAHRGRGRTRADMVCDGVASAQRVSALKP
ncbi:hypothetical protein GCM10011583_30190 [Streptomyces camponoticapitis]|uniref:Uncharacterized protein n=1 Tax=Streptomyces camponoticapitis TaxID=1616125 RepID=A0ABQ2E5D7_9ACTN|nr:hypothetical protein GCM10011583_30190 [Streptomyces camponoticapitis]